MAILHITFSLSTQGSIKHAIRQNHLQRDESVRRIDDLFSIGPLSSLEERNSVCGKTSDDPCKAGTF